MSSLAPSSSFTPHHETASANNTLVTELSELSMPNHINLLDRKILVDYMGEKFKDENSIKAAQKILARIYESPPRALASHCGFAFATCPEILAYAMQFAKDKIVLEIAGASGENAIMLAFSGAKKVYMNELSETEIDNFESLKKHLPPCAKEKLTSISGDCLNILNNNLEIEGKVSLVICHNLIHFFNDEMQEQLFRELRQILKPDGVAIFTVNGIYNDSNQKTAFLMNPKNSAFNSIHCLVTDILNGTAPCCVPYSEMTHVSGKKVSSDYENIFLYKRNGEKWSCEPDKKFFQFDSIFQKKVRDSINETKPKWKSIKFGKIRLLSSNIRFYNKENLQELFLKNGFSVEYNFSENKFAHLMNPGYVFDETMKIGIIVKRA